MNRAIRWAVAAMLAVTLLDGCVLLFGGAAVGTAVVASDRRSVGIQLEDDRIVSRVDRALIDIIPKTAMNVEVTSYNRKVLLAGEVRTAEMKAQAEAAAARVENVRQVVNELTVGDRATLGDRTDDTLIAGKVKTSLLSTDGLPAGVVKTTVNRGVVYLLGKVTAPEGEAAAKAASRVSGVRRVVKLFDLMTDQELEALKKGEQAAPSGNKNQPAPGK
jgi:osmotically-inducible protein OsmY